MKSVIDDIKSALKRKDRPHWEVMTDDGMNKTLKFVVFCIFAYGFGVVVIELWEKFV